MTKTIEQLQARVAELSSIADDATKRAEAEMVLKNDAQARIAELEAENARLNSSPTIEACRQMIRDKAVKEASDLHTELSAERSAHAAAALSNVQLREALQIAVDTPHMGQDKFTLHVQDAAIKALSAPISTEALDKYVAERMKSIFEWPAVKARIDELTRQRDEAIYRHRKAEGMHYIGGTTGSTHSGNPCEGAGILIIEESEEST